MDIKNTIKRVITSTCIIFTLITAVYMLILQFMNVGEDYAAVEAHRVLLFFLFSLLASIANAIRAIKKLNGALRWICHYAIIAFGFYTCFMLPVDMRPSFMITGIVIFTVGYLIVYGARAVLLSRFRRKSEDTAEYKSQFKK